MRICFILILVVLVASFLASDAFSHGLGASLEQEVGQYLVDIGYNPPELRSQTSVAFDFALANKEDGRGVPFSSVWVQVVKEQKTVLAAGVEKPEVGPTTLVYTFPQKGEYELSARFRNAEGTLAEASFPLSVGGEQSNNSPFSLGSLFIGAGIGVLLGFGASLAIFRKK